MLTCRLVADFVAQQALHLNLSLTETQTCMAECFHVFSMLTLAILMHTALVPVNLCN